MKQTFSILAAGLVTLTAWANGGEDFPFHVGEKLTYQIQWGPLTAGQATLEVAGIETIDGHDCYHLVATAKTGGLAALLFRIETKTESWFDVKELCTRRFRQDRLEGKRRRTDEARYDYIAGKLITTNLIKQTSTVTNLPGPAQDVISSLYYVRTQALAIDVESKFLVNMGGPRYDVTVRPDARKQMYFRPVGNVQALRIEPNPTLAIVAANKGRMWFWVSDDARKLPLLVASEMKIGNAKFILSEVTSANPTLDRMLRKPALTMADR